MINYNNEGDNTGKEVQSLLTKNENKEENGIDNTFNENDINVKKKERKRTFWKYFTAILLFICYMVSYCCVFTIGTASPLIEKDLNMKDSEFGLILILSRSIRIVPKLLSGAIVDIIGGKIMFVFGELFTAAFTIVFGFGSSIWYFTLMWSGNNIASCFTWPSLVKIISKWFDKSQTGRIMGFMSLSFLFGDGLARLYLSAFVAAKLNWRQIFWVAGGTLLFFNILSMFLLKEPKSLGLEEALYEEEEKKKTKEQEINDMSINQMSIEEETIYSNNLKERIKRLSKGIIQWTKAFPRKLFDLFWPIFKNPSFWVLCLEYIGITLIRYAINDWSALYYSQQARASASLAAFGSVLFPIAGGVGALIIGWIVDRVTPLKRDFVMIVFNVIIMMTLFLVYLFNALVDMRKESSHGTTSSYIIIPMILFSILGATVSANYSLPAGCLAIKFGGKNQAATLAALFDTASTAGSVLSGVVGSAFLDRTRQGWSTMFLVLLGVSAAITLISILFLFIEMREFTNKYEKKNKETTVSK
ncbi:hypothetical protein ABK040_003153 [Willaertia magna]